MMKAEKFFPALGLLITFITILAFILMGISSYIVVNVACAELLATFTLYRGLSLKKIEKAFLIPGLIIVSLVMIVVIAVVSLLGYMTIGFIILIYGIALVGYTVVLYFAKRMYIKTSGINHQFNQLQVCLEALEQFNHLNLDEEMMKQIPLLSSTLKSLDLSRDFDLDSLARSLIYFQNHYQDEDYDSIQEFQYIQSQIQQYQLISQQAKYGKV